METQISIRLQELLSAGDTAGVASLCTESHPATAAEAIGELEPGQARTVLRLLDHETRAEVFSHLDQNYQGEVITLLSRIEAARLLTDMPHDDRADLFKSLPDERQAEILPAMAQAEREDIRRLTSYEEGTAGSVMTSDYATLKPWLTAAESIERLREAAPDKETIYTAYVVDENRKLLGYVPLKDLIVARRHDLIESIMLHEVNFVRASDDQEEAARMIQKYDLIALPVVDSSDSLVGIITHDDALDIITQEHTEDVEKLMAIAGAHEAAAYMKTGILEHFRNRAVWIVALAVLGMVSGYIVQSFEALLMQFAILMVFMPMLVAAGGNTGSQSATLVIRGLALKEVSFGNAASVLLKEFKVALMLGLVLGALAYLRVIIFGGGSSFPEGFSLEFIGLAIAVALGIQVVVSTLTGALLPLGVAKVKLDPAVVASPALTTIVDITGLVIYFTTVKLMLRL